MGPSAPRGRAGWAYADFLESALSNAGISYDRINVDNTATPRLNLTATFWAEDGTPKYRGFAM
jgi:hypothetical protein